MTSKDREAAVIAAVPKQLLIGDAWRDAEGGATLKIEDPSTGEVLCDVADATPADGMAALEEAAAAQGDWAATAPRRRSEILHDAFRLLMERQDDLAGDLACVCAVGLALFPTSGSRRRKTRDRR